MACYSQEVVWGAAGELVSGIWQAVSAVWTRWSSVTFLSSPWASLQLQEERPLTPGWLGPHPTP